MTKTRRAIRSRPMEFEKQHVEACVDCRLNLDFKPMITLPRVLHVSWNQRVQWTFASATGDEEDFETDHSLRIRYTYFEVEKA